MKILIVDDESPARSQHKRLLNEFFPELQVCAEAASVEEAWQLIRLHNPGLVLLDVDAFNQPGVENSKLASYAVLGNQSEKYLKKAAEMKGRPDLLKRYTL